MHLTRLHDLREDAELSQTEFAVKIGVAQTTYSGYERGFREPSLEILCRIADYYNTSTDYLLGRTNDSTPPRK